MARSAVNIILPDSLLQRAQILTWTRDVKIKAFKEWGVTAVVNFWPKIDPDFADIGLDWYWQLSAPRSEIMLESYMELAAAAVTDYLWPVVPERRVLVLCEAGKTRSVFFCVLIVKEMMKMTYTEALALVQKAVPSHSLKGFMLEWLEKQDKVK